MCGFTEAAWLGLRSRNEAKTGPAMPQPEMRMLRGAIVDWLLLWVLREMVRVSVCMSVRTRPTCWLHSFTYTPSCLPLYAAMVCAYVPLHIARPPEDATLIVMLVGEVG